jgi:two-component sensor histidine kinase
VQQPKALDSPPRLAPSAVFITEQLRHRTPQRQDSVREKGALQTLAVRMADNPADVLPRFVELAMELTGATSAGLSLYDAEGAPDIFEWRHLRGTLACFEKATTPRNHSPCGVTLDQNGPTLATYPERAYDWIADAGITVPEVLLVPLYICGAPLGTLWVVSDEIGHFDSGDARTTSELASFVGIALRMAQNEAQLRAALDEQELVAREMSHRLKNVFAIAEGMVRVSARSSETPQAMAQAISGRLQALSNSHGLLRRKVRDIGVDAPGTDLAALIRLITKAHEPVDGSASCFTVAGPAIACGDHAVNGIALLIHELATNASKYGALSTRGGHVQIRWQVDGTALTLTWTETGGPTIEGPPARLGFGTTLAERTVKGQFRGNLVLDWQPAGLMVRMQLKLDRISL